MRFALAGVAVMAVSLSLAGLAAGEELKLTVDWNGVTAASPFPVTGGIPFARGVLKDGSAVKLSAGGQARPLQTEVLAVWPDQSVKWLLLDFEAAPGTKEFVLEYGGAVKLAQLTQGIAASEKDGTVTVDTGALKFTVKSSGSGFIDELAYGGKTLAAADGKRLNFLDFLHTKDPADYHPMDRLLTNAEPDPSKVAVTKVWLEKTGPLHAVAVIDGVYKFAKVGSTIQGTDVKGDCPFRIRIHAWAGRSLLKVEHFFYYEGDGDHDFAKSLGLKVAIPAGAGNVRYIGERTISATGPLTGLYQANCDSFAVWNSDGKSVTPGETGRRFEGVLDVTAGGIGIAVGIRQFWQNAAASLHADLKEGTLGMYFWPPEAPPLDFRRHAREWSVGETGTPDDPNSDKPAPMKRANYFLASKGVGKTHYALVYLHPAGEKPEDILNVYRLFSHRPLVWADAHYYASTLALGPYREVVKGEHDDVEEVIQSAAEVWKSSRERFRWYGFWLFGNVCQDYNGFVANGRWCQDFGRWGWANGDSVGRLAYALMLQAVRRCDRGDVEFGEDYLYAVHDVVSTHTPAYPHHGGGFIYVKGAAHRHGAWPWACPYVGARGAHPVGAKIYYFLTGEGHAKDILEEITQLALKNPNGGEGDGDLGPNAQIFIYQWEATGKDEWKDRLKAELDKSDLLKKAESGWNCMMAAAFGIKNALDEYMDLSGDRSMKGLSADFAERCTPAKFKGHWTWGGYYRVYADACNATGDPKYREWINEMLAVLVAKGKGSLAFKMPKEQWPGPAGGPTPLIDANIVRDVPFAIFSLHADPAPAKEVK
jgi:hypothetical protein